MLKRRRLLQAGAAATLLGTAAACNSSDGPGGGAQEHEFTDAATGTLSTMGFNPSDEVGQSRADHAA